MKILWKRDRIATGNFALCSGNRFEDVTPARRRTTMIKQLKTFGTALALLTALSGTAALAQKPSNSTPTPIQDVDNPARQPFMFTQIFVPKTGGQAQVYFNVPAGKRLVIEYVTAEGR